MDISKSYLEFKVLFNFFDFFRVAFSLVLKLLVTNICLRFYKIQLHTEKWLEEEDCRPQNHQEYRCLNVSHKSIQCPTWEG